LPSFTRQDLVSLLMLEKEKEKGDNPILSCQAKNK
jgi:hypothetical protein